MAKEIIWSLRANADLQDIHDYINKDSEIYALSVIKQIISTIENIPQFPLLGRVVPEFNIENLRERISGNYRVVYRINKSQNIEIVTIHHSARLLKEP
ncbi:type II toxin-antitoxin system RelE/ParE family toxin [Leptospira sp. 2 VSF19]|uniref:Type II toxin-antitoxin system RelE/ParE family toxin n=1 Tax=Leptospira soteropolitanensis TaxID=2950025 RepID=A0AAW5VTH6_9LEPT|nr:type II toxin-antitoxin system RelE/ParE family toxin [Leptospira soteropolitanensis]MCW7494705.1 type II toxin-antitoxin system RelE/ParE family toxin [Leptospira soteropolitanensis]MCW7502306.1 type II toxin-antitoxin system RelE/ParE family toxin [Leptospira soteropolitanensis]MCW7524540.1 type II toxin-antitoxin system RelE/ParE family toxin [Leptospira soteropolitanensis]MCW7528404.1 type II toxin-antitoxin system RelE/ParE family toxin [Leptospira soteropolitanensis]MCW7532270.1 type 